MNRPSGKIAIGLILSAGLLSAASSPATGKEEPVGLLLSATGSTVLRSGTETPLAARAGDILFAGDELRTVSGPAGFLYCPGKTSQTLDQGGDLIFDAKLLKPRTGKLSASQPVNACFLPQVVRVTVASQQHYGVSTMRGLTKPDGDVVLVVTALAANVRADIDPLETALRANPNDTAALVNEAAIYDRNKLEANALASYRRVAAQWKDAVWVRGRIFELEESLATQAALKAAEISPDAKYLSLSAG